MLSMHDNLTLNHRSQSIWKPTLYIGVMMLHHSPGGLSRSGRVREIAPTSIGSCTRLLNGSSMRALALQGPHQGPPPTSNAAVLLRASTMGTALAGTRPWESSFHTRSRQLPKNVSCKQSRKIKAGSSTSRWQRRL
eukprot:GHRQ01030162.1.p1 GENE.GHRQ01030162.1~~GHRQ01030162.1.p1  ORF type:complete len:136 (-),score=23.61 GHRQ01030162.1:82-489(-)